MAQHYGTPTDENVLADWITEAVRTVDRGFQGAARAELDAVSDQVQAKAAGHCTRGR